MSTTDKKRLGLKSGVKERLIQQMLSRKPSEQAAAKTASPATTGRTGFDSSKIPEEFYRFDKHPGYKQLLVHKLAADGIGLESPFFRTHDTVAGSTTQINGKQYINYASYNYLDLCGHPEVAAAADEAIRQYGTSVSASRPVAGERGVQRKLEQALAAAYGVEDCAVFVSGHATNVTTIGYLFGKKDLILHDELIHNSVLQGAKLAQSHRVSFAHNDWQALEDMLAHTRGQYERVLIVIEGIYSMDGDMPELPEFIRIKNKYRAFLMVDEAHSQGVLGEKGAGIAEHFGVSPIDVDIWMGTLSKTLASCGGFIAGESALVEHLKFAAPGFLYSVGIAPPLAAAAFAALRIMQQEPARVAQLQRNGELFLKLAKEKGLDTGRSAGYAVIPVVTGSSIMAVRLANNLMEHGIHVQPIIYPAVEEGMARLRFFICSSHTEEQIRYTVDTLAREFSRLQ